EFDEDFSVSITASDPNNPATSIVTKPKGTAVIIDDDATPTISVQNASVTEGTPPTQITSGMVVTVSLSAPSGKVIRATVSTMDDVAKVANKDYDPLVNAPV